MATEDQLGNQRELNKALGEYTSGLTDASDFISILSSRSSELVDQYRALGRLSKGDFTEGNKQALVAIRQVAKAARDMQNPYEEIKKLQKDIEKAERNRRQLINNIGAETKRLNDREKKDLEKIEAQRNKILGIEDRQRIVEDKLGKKRVNEAESFFDLQVKIKEQEEFINELALAGIKADSEAYLQAEASLMTMEAQKSARAKNLTDLQKEFLLNEEGLSTERDKLETQEDGLSLQQKMLLALQETLIAQEKGLDYLEDQENRLKTINRAQSFYNNTLGISGKLLKRLGFEGSKIQDAIDAGSEASGDLAKQLTNSGQEAVGLGSKLNIFFKGLGSFLKVLAKEIFALFTLGVLNKFIVQPFKLAFNALLAPAKKVAGEIKGYFNEFVEFFMDSFFSIKGFVQSFKVGEELLFKYSQATADLATNLGISTNEAKTLFNQADRIGNKLAMLPEEVLKLTESLQQAFGTTQKFSDETVESFGVLVQRLGFTNKQAADFVKLGQLQGKNAEELNNEYGLQIKSLKARENIALNESEVMKEVANASSAIVLTSRGHGTNLGIAAFNAKKLGLELSKVESIGSSLLDFESSISKEMEAELLTGKNLNLEKARQAALNNDLGTLASEISRQAGSAAEFGRMNVIQQEALAAAVGMTRNELADVLKTQELLAGTGFEDMSEAQADYLKLVEKTGSEEKAMALMREKGASRELVEQVRKASAQELEAKRQRALVTSQLEMAEAMRPVAQAFRGILQLVQDIRGVMIKEMEPFFKEFGISIEDASDSLEKGFLSTASKLGKKLNDIGLILIDFSKEHGPEIKKTFLAVYDVFESFYGLLGDIVKELFDIEGVSNIGDPLERSLSIVKSTAESVANFIKGIDAGKIADNIKSAASGVVSFYEGLKATINYIKENPIKIILGAAGLKGLQLLFKMGATPLNPMYVRDISKTGGIPQGGTGFAQGTRLGRFGSRIATTLSPNITGQLGTKGGAVVTNAAGTRLYGAAAQNAARAGTATVAGNTAAAGTGTAIAGLATVAGALAAAGFVAKGAYDVAQLNERNTEGESAEALGGLVGAGGGAALGAAIGTLILPGVGTAIGAGIGAGVGYFGGRAVGSMEKYQDSLDKARKKLVESEKQREAAQSLRKAQQEFLLIQSTTNLQSGFDSLAEDSGVMVNGALELTGLQLKEFADDLLLSGQITTKQYEDAISGVITSSTLLETAIDNQKTKFAELETSTQGVIDAQTKLAQKEADRLFGDKGSIEAKQNVINNFLNDDEFKSEILDDNQKAQFEDLQKTIEGFRVIRDRSGLGTVKLKDAIDSSDNKEDQIQAVEKALMTGFGFERQMAKEFAEEAITETQTLFEATKKLISETTGGILNPEQLDIATRAAVEQQSKLGTEFLDKDLEETGDMVAAGLMAVGKTLETALARNENYVSQVGVQSNQMAINANLINESLEKLYKSFNAQTGEDEANNLISNLLDFEIGDGKTFKSILTEKQLNSIQGFASEGISSEELKNIEEIIVNLQKNEGVNEDVMSTLLKSFNSRVTQETNDGVTTFHNVQKVADAASISNNGPFKIEDVNGNLAITHPNDKLVVSPNVSYVSDGMSGKGGPVFPVSENFGALDVKVGQSGVMVQKVKDGTAGNISYTEVAGTTSSTQINNLNTIQQLGVTGVTSENYKDLFTAQAVESFGKKYFNSTMKNMADSQLLSNFTPSANTPPAKDSFIVNYQDGKQDQITNSGELSFPAINYKTNDIESISASGNGLLALYRAIERLGKGLAHRYTIGFNQERTSELIDFDTTRINDLVSTFNSIRNATSYQAVLPKEQNQTHFINKNFVVSEGVEDFIENSLYSTYYNYIPRDIRKNLKGQTGDTRYNELGLNPYDFTPLPGIIGNIEKTPRSTHKNRYAGGGAARDIRDFFVPQYRENIIQFIKNYVSEEKAEMFRSAINPKIGVPTGWDYIFGKKEYGSRVVPSANLSTKTGEYEEGSIQRVQDAVSRKEKKERKKQRRADKKLKPLELIDIFDYVENNRLEIEHPTELLGIKPSPIEQSEREKRQTRRAKRKVERQARRAKRRAERQIKTNEKINEPSPEIAFSQPLLLTSPEIEPAGRFGEELQNSIESKTESKAEFHKIVLENISPQVEELTLRKGYTPAPTHEEVYEKDKLLKYKMQDVGKNTLVRDVQTTLKDTYNLDEGFSDGFYGGGSRRYLKQYQSSQGLNSDGIVGGRTYRALFTPKKFAEYLKDNPEIVSQPELISQPEIPQTSTPLAQTPDFMLSPQGQLEKKSLTYTRDGFFGEVFEASKDYYNLVTEFGISSAKVASEFISSPQEWLYNTFGELGSNAPSIVGQIFNSSPIKKGAFNLAKNTTKKLPYIGPIIDALLGGYKGYEAIQEYKNDPQSPPISKLYEELGSIGYETLGGMGGSILGGIALTPLLGPPGTIVGSIVGGILGQILGKVIADKFGSGGLGEFMVNAFTELPQKVEDGSASPSRGPFSITDRFGSTAVTATNDGVVVSPNISYVNDGMTNANSIETITSYNIPQNTPVVENVTTDNSTLEQKVADLDTTMKQFVQQMNQVVNRPVIVELDGNKVGESIGRNSYRIQ